MKFAVVRNQAKRKFDPSYVTNEGSAEWGIDSVPGKIILSVIYSMIQGRRITVEGIR